MSPNDTGRMAFVSLSASWTVVAYTWKGGALELVGKGKAKRKIHGEKETKKTTCPGAVYRACVSAAAYPDAASRRNGADA